MTTLTIKTEKEEVIEAVKALLRGFKVAYEESSYDPEFVAKIEISMQQVRQGKTIKYEPGSDLWDLVNSK
ncbi:hypothetical protein SAMN04487996_12319 [Dyadobacter soli]|uniref:Uncharacterized protein n=1 Tax=Dyadobacter soli TaxID=659014 RepID=A0A1G7X1N8_9BACT|nr:DUF2683 family protein [Dyadobacter soli]SDG78089.1 hypothetical protein SAMN04487996_12319 [Dyadobacter soli]